MAPQQLTLSLDDLSDPVTPVKPASLATPAVPKPKLRPAEAAPTLSLDAISEPVAPPAPQPAPSVTTPSPGPQQPAIPEPPSVTTPPPTLGAAAGAGRLPPPPNPFGGGNSTLPGGPGLKPGQNNVPNDEVQPFVGTIQAALEGMQTGAVHAGKSFGQTGQTLTGGTPTYEAPPPEASLPDDWSDPKKVAKWAGFQIGATAPAIPVGAGAAYLASYFGGPVALAVGAGVGGIGFFGLSFAQAMGPAYAQHLAEGMPKQQAFDQAFEEAKRAGIVGGISGALFSVAPFKSALANIFLQSTVVQPAVSVGARIDENIKAGKDPIDGIGADYVSTALGTLVPISAFHGAGILLAGKQPVPRAKSTPEEIADFLARARAAQATDPKAADANAKAAQEAIFRELLKKEGWSQNDAEDLLNKVYGRGEPVTDAEFEDAPPPGYQPGLPPPEPPAAAAAGAPPPPPPSGGAPAAPAGPGVEAGARQGTTPRVGLGATPRAEPSSPTPTIARPVAPLPVDSAATPAPPSLDALSEPVVGTGTRDDRVVVTHPDDIARASEVVNPEPSDAQKIANNYQMGHVRLPGLPGYPITIETAPGAVRTAADRSWQSPPMPAAYGYIRRSRAADGDHVDVYLGQDVASDRAFVIDQINPDSGAYDEAKVVLGALTQAQAIDLYRRSFSDEKNRVGGVTEMSVADLKELLGKGPLDKPLTDLSQGTHGLSDNAGIRDVAAHASAVLRPGVSGLPAVRGAGDQGVPAVEAELRRVSGGHGAAAGAGVLAGSQGREQGLQPEELPLGDGDATGAEQAILRQVRGLRGRVDDARRMVAQNGGAGADTLQSLEARLARREGALARLVTARGQGTASTDVSGQDTAREGVGAPAQNAGGNAVPAAEQGVAAEQGTGEKRPEGAPEAATQKWWDHHLTQRGRLDAIVAAHGKTRAAALSRTRWRHLSPEVRGELRAYYARTLGDTPNLKSDTEAQNTENDGKIRGKFPESGTSTKNDIRGLPPKGEAGVGAAPPVGGGAVRPGGADAGVGAKAGAAELGNALPAGIEAVRDRLLSHGFANILAARKFVEASGWKAPDESAPLGKQIDEAIEFATVLAAREIVARNLTPRATFEQLVDLYEAQPKLAVRTGKSMADQAYSTTAPLAFLASRLADVAGAKSVFEPTAGNGMLLIEAAPASVMANEIDPTRAAALKAQGFADVRQGDATARYGGKSYDTVVMNPPFGTMREGGAPKTWTVDGWKTRNIDHAIALNALKALADDGRAVLIVAGTAGRDQNNEALTRDGARTQGYNTQAQREFNVRLYRDYNVVDRFTVNGDLYARQGAHWPVDVIVIHGRGKSALALPGAELPPMFDTWEALKAKVNADGRSRQDAAEPARPGRAPAGNAAEGVPRSTRGNAGNRPAAGGRGSVGGDTSIGPEPGAIRGGGNHQQPADAGEPAKPAARVDAAGAGDGRRSGELPVAGERKPRLTNEAGQTTYQPKSRNADFNSLVPANQADAVRGALDRVAAAHGGDIDAFVAKELGYDRNELGSYFSAEQVDALALAIHAHEHGSAIVLGDQTGVGKGRVVAAMARYAKRKGLVPVLFTEKPDLYGDMYRDLRDIGMPGARMVMTNTGTTVPMDEEAVDWKAEMDEAIANRTKRPARRGLFLRNPDIQQAYATLDRIAAGEDLADVVFTTYDQTNTVKGKDTARRAFLKKVGKQAMFLLDESHNAGGQGQEGWKPAADKPVNRAEFLRELVGSAGGVIYSSATWAKRPQVMDLYRRTDMGKAVEKPEMLPALIERGGVPLQQIVSSMLANSGQYIRRERSFDGIAYTPVLTPVDSKTYGQFTSAVKAVYTFDRSISGKEGERAKLMAKALAAMGSAQMRDNAIGDAGAHSTEFSSIMHNLVNQMLLSIQAGSIAADAVKAWKAGEKPSIALSNTMETFLNDYADQHGVTVGMPLAIDFGDLLKRYLERSLRITIKDGEGKVSHHQFKPSDLSPEAQDRYRTAEAAIEAGDYAAMPVSPIDAMREAMEAAGMKVAEITGRHFILKHGHLANRPKAEMGAGGKRVTVRKYNNGQYDALIFNKSGSTGISMHAKADNDGRPRHMIIAQADPNIDTFMQTLGRTNRTGQIHLPRYTQSVPDVPAAVRPAAVLLKKMASLNANTTAARGSIFNAKSAVDFVNQYGDIVAERILADDWALNHELGGILKDEEEGAGKPDDGADLIRKLTGRLVLLAPERQQEVIDRIQADYEALIKNLDALGENMLEAKTLELDAKTVDRTEIKPATGDNDFLAPVYLERINIKSPGRAMAPTEIVERVESLLAAGTRVRGLTDTPANKLHSLHFELEQVYRERLRNAGAAFAKWKHDNLAGIKNLNARERATKEADDNFARFTALTRMLTPGAIVHLSSKNGEMPAVVIELRRPGKAKNPVALGSWAVSLAIPDSGREVQFNLSSLRQVGLGEKAPTPADGEVVVGPTMLLGPAVFDLFDAARKEGRENRLMVTGNILAGFDLAKGHGQIVNYKTDAGEIRPGIFVPRSTSHEDFMQLTAVRLAPAQVGVFLERMPSGRVTSHDGVVAIHREGGRFTIDVAANREKGGRYFLEESVRKAVGDRFVKTKTREGQRMQAADLSAAQMQAAVVAMAKLGAVFETSEHQNVAREVVKANPAPRRQAMAVPAEVARPFYSAVLRAVENSKTAKASPEQWLATIKNGPGIKQEEIDWIGLEDWLKGQSGPLTREAVADFVRANQIEVKDVVRRQIDQGDAQHKLIAEYDAWIREHGLPQMSAADLLADDEAIRAGQDPDADPLQQVPMFPGREGGLTVEEGQFLQGFILRWEDAEAERGEDETSYGGGNLVLPGGENYHELLLTLPTPVWLYAGRKDAPSEAAAATVFRGGHFDVPNVLVHVRFNTRTDAAGKKTLFLEEIQSDWHKQGRKRGYRTPAWVKAKAEYDGLLAERSALVDDASLRDVTRPAKENYTERERARLKTIQERFDALNAEFGATFSGHVLGVPDAPFKTTWSELAFKRMVRWAAEHGYDQLAWTPGVEQVKRYEAPLREVVRSIVWQTDAKSRLRAVVIERRQGDEYYLDVDENGVVVDANQGARDLAGRGETIENVVGKEIARRIMEEPQGKVEGDNLVIGGKGYSDLYDKSLVKLADKLGKKFGSKVGQAAIDAGDTYYIVEGPDGIGRRTNIIEGSPGSISEAQRIIDAARAAGREVTGPFGKVTVHALPITDAMRASVMQGQALFSRRPVDKGNMVFPGQPDGTLIAYAPTYGEDLRVVSAGTGSQAERLVNEVQSIVSRLIGNRVPVVFYDRIVLTNAEHGDEMAAAAKAGGSGLLDTVGGFYEHVPGLPLQSLISIAVGDRGYAPLVTARHEPAHDIYTYLLNEAEHATVDADFARGAGSTMRRYAAEAFDRAPDDPFVMNIPKEELFAFGFQKFDEKATAGTDPNPGRGLHIALRRIYEKLRRLFQALRHWLARNKISSMEDLYRAMSEGEMVSRRHSLEAVAESLGQTSPFEAKRSAMAGVRTPPRPPEPPKRQVTDFVRNQEDEIFKLATRAQADVSQMAAFMGRMKKAIGPGVIRGIDSRFYYHAEDLKGGHLTTPEQGELWREYGQPLKDIEQADYARASTLAREQSLSDDELADLQEEMDPEYQHRMVKGKTPQFDIFEGSDQSGNPIYSGRGLPHSTSSMKTPVYFAIEADDGERMVVSASSEGIHRWQNDQPQAAFRGSRGATLEIGKRYRILGRMWTVKRARTPEIEAATPTRYYKSFFATTVDNILRLRRVIRSLEYVRDLKATPEWAALSAGISAKHPRDWTQVDAPGLRGYWIHPRLANPINDYLQGGARVWKGKLAEKAEAVNRLAVGAMFWSPIPHIENVALHWVVARGWDWITPRGIHSLVADTMWALQATVTENADYRQYLRAGASLPSSRVTNRRFIEQMLRLVGHRVIKQRNRFQQVADMFGYGPVENMVKEFYRHVSQVLWMGNDVFMLQRIRELERKGYTRAAAIQEAGNHIPDYRLPSEVMGSRAYSELLQDPNLFVFNRYHYGIFKSYARMLADATATSRREHAGDPRGKGKKAFDAVGQLLTLGFIAIFLGPYLNAATQALFGNDKRTHLVARGPFSVPTDIYELIHGDINTVQFIMSFLSPTPLFGETLEQVFGYDLYVSQFGIGSGHIVRNKANWAQEAQDRLKHIFTSMPLGGQVDRGSKKGVGNVLLQQLGVSTP